jgi:hypothetical protein
MTIQINTDNNIESSARLEDYLKTFLNEELSRYSDDITRIELHLSDENGSKGGGNDKRCMLEARLINKKPFAVVSTADTIEKAVSDAAIKLKSSLDKK